MEYWQSGLVLTFLALALLLAAAEVVRQLVPPLRRLGLPACILAGLFGLFVGPDILGWLPWDRTVLESVVYHGLAVVFIAVGLQGSPPGERKGPGVTSMSFAIGSTAALQLVVGVCVVLVIDAFAGPVHPGVGVMLPLGFEQGPGQALALGAAWEEHAGLTDGAQVGLIVAAIGYGWSVLLGIPLVIWGRARGLVASSSKPTEEVAQAESAPSLGALGAVDPLTHQVLVIGIVYLVTFGICAIASTLLEQLDPGTAPMVWGFHFIVGAVVAMALRPFLVKVPGVRLHAPSLGRISNLAVDVMTCAALGAVQLGVLGANALPILLVTTIGALVTVLFCLWFASRAFPDAPFEHAIVWFGMSTGTLAMGLALLRIVDPKLSSPAAMSAVLGSAGATPMAGVVLVGLAPAFVRIWPDGYPTTALALLGATVAFTVLLIGLWRGLGPLRFRRPLALWSTPERGG